MIMTCHFIERCTRINREKLNLDHHVIEKFFCLWFLLIKFQKIVYTWMTYGGLYCMMAMQSYRWILFGTKVQNFKISRAEGSFMYGHDSCKCHRSLLTLTYQSDYQFRFLFQLFWHFFPNSSWFLSQYSVHFSFQTAYTVQ